MAHVVRPIAALALTLAVTLAAPPGLAEAPTESAAFLDYGAGIALDSETPLATLLAEPERFTETPQLVRGRLVDICQKKGCWTVLADGQAQVRVRFADYGFFVPTDAIGRDALVEGVVTVRTLSEADAKHYAAESKHGDPDAIEGPQHEIGFLATGVRIHAPRE